MGNKVVRVDGKTLKVDDKEYKLTPGLIVLILRKYPRSGQWNSNDYQVNKSLVAQTKVKSTPNRTGTVRPDVTWKWKHMLKKMVFPWKRRAEEEECDETDTDSVESYPDPASIRDVIRVDPYPGFASSVDIGESTRDMLSPGSDIGSPVFQKVVLEVIMCYYLHQRKSTDWARRKWKRNVHRFV